MNLHQLDVPFELKAQGVVTKDDDSQVGVFEGMASTFGNTDLMGDIIAPGAFAGSIKQPKRIKMLWQHNPGEPIGVWTDLEETDKGLKAKGELLLNVQRGAEAHVLMKAGALDALSIGFRTPKGGSDIDQTTGVRTLKKIDLMEISPVTFPANPKARIGRVKALLEAGDFPTVREFERWLTQDAGFSRKDARAIIRHGYETLVTQDADDESDGKGDLGALIERMGSRRRTLKAA